MASWKKIEAVLFAAGNYLNKEQLMNLTQLNKKQLEKSLEELKKHYSEIDSSLELLEDEEGWKLNVKRDYADMVQAVVADAEMPKPIMETLALIAYKSPVLQSDIIKGKGTHAYEHISYLERRKFISREQSGRSYKLKVTDKFNDYFDIDEPQMRELFKDVQEPNPEDINVEVKENDDAFETQITERLKKPPQKEDEVETNTYLSELDKKIEDVKSRLEMEDETIKSIKEEQAQKESETEEDEQKVTD